MIEEILEFNEKFVAGGDYEPYITSKYPDKKLAILTCMDTRLTTLLPAALGLKNGDAKVIKNAGGLVMTAFDSALRSLLVGIYELGVEEVMVIHHTDCGACKMSGVEMRELILSRGVSPIKVDTVEKCGITITEWLEGFHDTERSVRNTVNNIRNHPLVPADVKVSGYIINSTTGKLSLVDC